MNSKVNILRVISGTCLIAGTMVGAGMLGIPLVTGAAGFFPGIFITFAVWLFMYCTGLLFLEVVLWMPEGSNVLSISGHFFGKGGRLFSGGMFVFLYYSLMIAYFSAGAPLLGEALGLPSVSWQSFSLFGILFATIVAIGPKSIDRANIILSISMVVSWIILIVGGRNEVQVFRLTYSKWPSMIFAMPILFSAFGFHNIIPSLCTYLNRDRKVLRIAIFFGSIIPFMMYIIWQWLIIGAIPQEVLNKILNNEKTITTIFESVTGSKYFPLIGRFFAFFAIVTSTLGVSFSMVDFFGDGFQIVQRSGWKRIGLTLLVFIPPFILAALHPGIFAMALGLAGGFGEAFLNGILPIGLFWMGQYARKWRCDLKWLENKNFLLFLSVYALFVVILEIYYLLLG